MHEVIAFFKTFYIYFKRSKKCLGLSSIKVEKSSFLSSKVFAARTVNRSIGSNQG